MQILRYKNFEPSSSADAQCFMEPERKLIKHIRKKTKKIIKKTKTKQKVAFTFIDAWVDDTKEECFRQA